MQFLIFVRKSCTKKVPFERKLEGGGGAHYLVMQKWKVKQLLGGQERGSGKQRWLFSGEGPLRLKTFSLTPAQLCDSFIRPAGGHTLTLGQHNCPLRFHSTHSHNTVPNVWAQGQPLAMWVYQSAVGQG